jgi:uncharacterized protein YbjT (DUF2867 family)
MEQKRSIVIVGATGMVGGHALEQSLEHPEVGSVTVIVRRPTGVAHPKLRQVLHADFADCVPLAAALAGHDAALYCLGAYTGAVPDAAFRRITVDYTMEFARCLREHSPSTAFCFLSGKGADQSGKSRFTFARYKGEAERALQALGFFRLHIFRPGYIYPVVPRHEPNLSYRLTRVLFPALRRVAPGAVIPSVDLARAMLLAGLHGTGAITIPVLENSDIQALLKQ